MNLQFMSSLLLSLLMLFEDENLYFFTHVYVQDHKSKLISHDPKKKRLHAFFNDKYIYTILHSK